MAEIEFIYVFVYNGQVMVMMVMLGGIWYTVNVAGYVVKDIVGMMERWIKLYLLTSVLT